MGEISMSGSNEGEGSGGHWSSDLSFRAFLSTLPVLNLCVQVWIRLCFLGFLLFGFRSFFAAWMLPRSRCVCDLDLSVFIRSGSAPISVDLAVLTLRLCVPSRFCSKSSVFSPLNPCHRCNPWLRIFFVSVKDFSIRVN